MLSVVCCDSSSDFPLQTCIIMFKIASVLLVLAVVASSALPQDHRRSRGDRENNAQEWSLTRTRVRDGRDQQEARRVEIERRRQERERGWAAERDQRRQEMEGRSQGRLPEQEMKQGMKQKIKQEIKQDMKQDMKQEMKQDMKQEIKQDIKQEMKQDRTDENLDEGRQEGREIGRQEGQQSEQQEEGLKGAEEIVLPNYEFSYGVYDPITGDHKDQWEKRVGDHVKGVYSLDQPDGKRRVVEYEGDSKRGLETNVIEIDRADVKKEDRRQKDRREQLNGIAHSYSKLNRID